MKIQDLLRKDVMLLDLQATEKTAVIEEMIKSLTGHGYVTDFETFKEGILAREALTSTGLGDGIAMPHSKNAAVKEATGQTRVLTMRVWMGRQLTSSS